MRPIALALAVTLALPAATADGAAAGRSISRGIAVIRGKLYGVMCRAPTTQQGRAGETQPTTGARLRPVRMRIRPDSVGDWSTATLVVGGAHQVLRFGGSIAPFAARATGVGAIGLGAVSVHRVVTAKSASSRVDGLHGVAWSLQGLAGLAKGLHAEQWVQQAGVAAGSVGGALQVGVGTYRLARGIRRGDREAKVLGAIDIGAGACWLASALSIATPYTLAGFLGLTAARMAYANRAPLQRAVKKLFGRRRAKSSSTPLAEALPPGPQAGATVREAAQTLLAPAQVTTTDGTQHQAWVVVPPQAQPH